MDSLSVENSYLRDPKILMVRQLGQIQLCIMQKICHLAFMKTCYQTVEQQLETVR